MQPAGVGFMPGFVADNFLTFGTSLPNSLSIMEWATVVSRAVAAVIPWCSADCLELNAMKHVQVRKLIRRYRNR